jgi:epoxide hydrolase-like predicted phosphatase
MNQGRTTAAIFDFGGVLMRTVDPVPRAELDARFALGPGGAAEIVFRHPLWEEAQTGRVGEAEFWADIGRRVGLEGAAVDEFRRLFWSGDRLDEELLALVRHLRRSGYRMGLLSNGPASLRNYLDDLGVGELFDVVVVSACEGVMKPDPAIYRLALERLGARPERTIFIDDLPPNVTGAESLGIQGVVFEGTTPLRKTLLEAGVCLPERVVRPVAGLRAILFDWGGVIGGLPDDELVSSIEHRLGLQAGELAEALWGKAWRLLSIGMIDEQQYKEHVAAAAQLAGPAQLDEINEELYGADRLHTQVVDAVRSLRGRYDLALVTNTWAGQADYIRERLHLDVEAEFDVYVNSAWVGMRKPDPAIFRLALSELDAEPDEAVLVDDLQRNLDSARQLGIHTVQFLDPETSLPELEALLGHKIASHR